jgi:transcriptional regulator with XRE-family HTH domain
VRGRLETLLARRLREIAKSKGIALSHIADRAGLARSYMWRLLDESSSATLDAVQRLADALEVEPLSLLASAGVEPAAVPSRPSKRSTRKAQKSKTTKRSVRP